MARTPEAFTRTEERRLRTSVEAGGDVDCPRCTCRMEARDVPPSDDVSYVRRRVWLHCAACRRGIVLDRPRTP